MTLALFKLALVTWIVGCKLSVPIIQSITKSTYIFFIWLNHSEYSVLATFGENANEDRVILEVNLCPFPILLLI